MKKFLCLLMVIFILSAGLIVSAAEPEKMTITGTKWLSYPEERLIWDQWCQEYNKLHPNIKVVIDWVSNTGYDERILTGFAGGMSPDFFCTNTSGGIGTPGVAIQKMALPLDKYIKGPNGIDAKDIPAPVWAACSYKGKKYGWSTTNGVQVLFYNKKMFRAAGVPFPNDNWTWNDLLAAAKKLTKDVNGDGVVEYGFQCDELNRIFISHLWSNRGKAFNNEQTPTKCLFNSPEGVAAAKFLVDLVKEGVSPLPASPGTTGAMGYRDAFKSEKVAMILDGSWNVNSFSRLPNLEYGTALVPKGKIRSGWYDCSMWNISTQSKHPDQTWDVLKFLESKDHCLALADYGGKLLKGIPTWTSATKDPKWQPIDFVEPIARQKEFARSEMVFVGSGTFYWTLLPAKLQEIIITGKDPKKGLDELVVDTQKQVLSKIPK